MKKTKGDEFGYQRGAVGYGTPSKADIEFLKSFDRKADREIYGEQAVGQVASVGSGAKLKQER
ncbi:MAG: hypothetical protein WAV38_32520 [Xanthobacteraceae bacterium]